MLLAFLFVGYIWLFIIAGAALVFGQIGSQVALIAGVLFFGQWMYNCLRAEPISWQKVRTGLTRWKKALMKPMTWRERVYYFGYPIVAYWCLGGFLGFWWLPVEYYNHHGIIGTEIVQIAIGAIAKCVIDHLD